MRGDIDNAQNETGVSLILPHLSLSPGEINYLSS